MQPRFFRHRFSAEKRKIMPFRRIGVYPVCGACTKVAEMVERGVAA